ncbi:uncharacterized protein LOC131891928 [Tigriopus californicus]|uniref:uncharacterized protein LOC131891928 n=1 Tax=Tigriopus californicus TaxID=6832 RepID=UPI0027DA8A17|nr:uncharacterized protein LOC131891928 [Tigriopus californicus]
MEPGQILLSCLLVLSLSLVEISTDSSLNSTQESRAGKLISMFQIVKFKNEACAAGGVRNGTCYTGDECKTRGGSSAGSCAGGYGVCCAFTLSCGATTVENCTYLVETGSASTISPCKYTVCPCSRDICRIRFDFMTFNIKGPVTGTAISDPAMTAATTEGGAIGDCTTDTFTITAPGNFAPPLICGFNSGQHMIVDASPDKCNEANFGLVGGGTRNWDIKVTQYACGDEQGGPDGCLQYFTGTTGTVASFNFPTTASILEPSTTHLSNQQQSMCWRQETNTCAICWIPEILGTDQITGSFGISTTAGGNKARGETDGKCQGDYLLIPDAQSDVATEDADTFVVGSIGSDVRLSDRVCGRQLSSANDNGDRRMSLSVCTQQRPFRMTFKTDADEVTLTSTSAAPNSAASNELSRIPGGIVGFNLRWTLQACS